MSEQAWYLYQNGQQEGPFDDEQVTQLFLTNMIAKDGYIFKIGWKDWRPVEEGYEILGLPNPSKASMSPVEYEAHVDKRKLSAPRATITGRAVVHNNGQVSIGRSVNISTGGVFIETDDQIFTVGDLLKLSLRCEGLSKAFNAEAKVMRFNRDEKYPIGYGLMFTRIDQSIQDSIQQLVNESNSRGDLGRFASR